MEDPDKMSLLPLRDLFRSDAYEKFTASKQCAK